MKASGTAGGFSVSDPKRPVRWPPLPRRIELVGGWVRISRPKQVDEGKNHADWDFKTRVIRVERGLSNSEAWRFLFHELTHARLDDTRMFIEVMPLKPRQEEAVCEAMASALHFQMRRQLEAEQW